MSGDDLTSNGTVRFMARKSRPSTELERGFDSKADIFSLAMVYYFVWERALPASPSATSASASRGVEKGAVVRPHPKPIRELVNHMWRLEAQDRPSAADVPTPHNVKHKPTFGGGVPSEHRPPPVVCSLVPLAPGH